jgi:sulfite dehydrogenase (quinone) subunit SoeC
MHPALSVIVFTTASGAGYGLLAWIGILLPTGLVPGDRGFGLLALANALILITAGLLCSTAHLGHPERAWRAFSQWRTSWLSREGVASLATYVPAGILGLAWIWLGRIDDATALCGLAAAVLATLTVFCTAMIYASLKTIRQWNDPWVPAVYLALAAMTGALWLNALVHMWGTARPDLDTIALVVTAIGLAAKLGYWRSIDTAKPRSTPETATGLAPRGGHVRFLESPHTEDNYLLQEMGYRIARKHARKLRRITLVLGFAAPALLTAVALAAGGPIATLSALLAAGASIAGVFVERWLFFAEARHTVTLYYGGAA